MVNKKYLRSGAIIIWLLTAVLLLSGSGTNLNSPCLQLSASGDLDGDGKTEEYILKHHVLTVKEGSQELWESPSNYCVDSFALDDVDNDGKINLVISLWKNGSFGKYRPFWHTGKDKDYKNHLFVYRLQDDTVRPVWCSSNLDRPILAFSIQDVNGDGLNELIVKEGTYKKISGEKYAPDLNGPIWTAVWQWDEWGFRLLESSCD